MTTKQWFSILGGFSTENEARSFAEDMMQLESVADCPTLEDLDTEIRTYEDGETYDGQIEHGTVSFGWTVEMYCTYEQSTILEAIAGAYKSGWTPKEKPSENKTYDEFCTVESPTMLTDADREALLQVLDPENYICCEIGLKLAFNLRWKKIYGDAMKKHVKQDAS